MLSNILDGEEVVLTGITHRIVSSSRSRCNFFLPPLHNRNILDFFKIWSRSRCSFFPPQCNFFLHCAAFFPFKQLGAGIGFGIWMQKNGPSFCFWTQSILSTFSTAVLHLSLTCYLFEWLFINRDIDDAQIQILCWMPAGMQIIGFKVLTGIVAMVAFYWRSSLQFSEGPGNYNPSQAAIKCRLEKTSNLALKLL